MTLLTETIRKISGQDQEWRQAALQRLNQLTMPHWALGRLMDLALDLAGMTRSLAPSVHAKAVVVMAADHGVVAEGVSRFPQEVTAQMVFNFVNGGAGINALARQAGAEVVVVDLGVKTDLSLLTRTNAILSRRIGPGTANLAREPAMHRDQALAAVEAGISVAELLGPRIELFGTGEMGIGNTTASTAIGAAITGQPVEILTGCGTGIDETQRRHKIEVLKRALELHQPDPADGLDILAKVGGFEIGGIAGLILGAAAQRKPVLVDGFISTAGALLAQSLAPAAVDFMICAHRSMEPGHRFMQEHLGRRPLLDLEMRLGEGTGAALAMNVVEAAVGVLTEVATFQEARVDGATP